MATQMLQLKKNNFLDIVPFEPATRGEIVELLDEYEFLDGWLTFLLEHFTANGRIVANEDGTFQRKAVKGVASRDAYRVEVEDGGYVLNHRVLEKGESVDKDAGEASTANRAIKNRTSAIFAQYKADCATVRELAPSED